MMLRSQEVPSRLVVGYLGGDFNVVGRYYQVREKHAHVWVEAYLEADQIPPAYFVLNHCSEKGPGSGSIRRLWPTQLWLSWES